VQTVLSTIDEIDNYGNNDIQANPFLSSSTANIASWVMQCSYGPGSRLVGAMQHNFPIHDEANVDPQTVSFLVQMVN
jgi:hypothetical protein